MSTTKIEVSVGAVSFSGEGDQAWLAEQLDKVLRAAPDLSRGTAAPSKGPQSARPDLESIDSSPFTKSLSSYIKEKGGESNQVDRFLITADWLRRRGATELATATISKALVDHQQKRLGNPADSLNKNVSKGFCEKNGTGFYITPEGLKKLGYE